MFFMAFFGINDRFKDIKYSLNGECPGCGRLTQYRVFMKQSCFHIFFIPLIRWNKRYYVETKCCGRIYELDPEIGESIARGENTKIFRGDLRFERKGHGLTSCPNCGTPISTTFEYCPKCGKRL